MGVWIVLVIRDVVIQGFVISRFCSRSMHVTVTLDGLNDTIHCSRAFNNRVIQSTSFCDHSNVHALSTFVGSILKCTALFSQSQCYMYMLE